jgi:type III secretion system needle length determinant
MKINPSSPDHSINSESSSTGRKSSSSLPSSAKYFEQEMSKNPTEKELGEKAPDLKQQPKEKTETDQRRNSAAKPAETPGDLMLRNLTGAASTEKTAAGAQPPPSLGETAKNVADRILVSTPDSTSNSTKGQEVRISLKSTQLAGVEIKITRWQGELQIQLITPDADKYQAAGALQNSLQKILGERFDNETVKVSVVTQGQDREQNDGRSRQRRNLAEELNNEKQSTSQ